MSTRIPLTVIMPAHNMETLIGPAIASVLNQTYPHFELWVLENGSTDRTAEVARSFGDPRVRVLELGPVGFAGALQYAIQHAETDWMARMDADDLCFPDRLEKQMRLLAARPELVFVGCPIFYLTPFNHILERLPQSHPQIVDTNLMGRGRRFADPSVIFNRRIAQEVGGTDLEFGMGDIPLWFRMLQRGVGWQMAEPLYLYRLRATSLSWNEHKVSQGMQVRAKYAPDSLRYYDQTQRQRLSFWRWVTRMEFIVGDLSAAQQALEFMEQEDASLKPEVERLRRRCRLGALASFCYAFRNRASLRHRPDLERQFAPLLFQGETSGSPTARLRPPVCPSEAATPASCPAHVGF